MTTLVASLYYTALRKRLQKSTTDGIEGDTMDTPFIIAGVARDWGVGSGEWGTESHHLHFQSRTAILPESNHQDSP